MCRFFFILPLNRFYTDRFNEFITQFKIYIMVFDYTSSFASVVLEFLSVQTWVKVEGVVGEGGGRLLFFYWWMVYRWRNVCTSFRTGSSWCEAGTLFVSFPVLELLVLAFESISISSDEYWLDSSYKFISMWEVSLGILIFPSRYWISHLSIKIF